jgi:hypothetical protein
MKRRPAEILGFEVILDTPCFNIACYRVNHPTLDDDPHYEGQLAFVCPFCGDVHVHGAVGPGLGDGDGNRSPHCLTRSLLNKGGYNLVEQEHHHAAGDLPKRLIRAAESHHLRQLREKGPTS